MSVFRLATLALLGSAAAMPHVARQSSLDDYLTKQEPISQQGVLDNIGPDGAKVEGASAGIVVASPSKSEPDCAYPATRIS
jgi:glucoamylase